MFPVPARLGNHWKSLRLVLFAALAAGASFVGGSAKLLAECGDYVKITNPRTQGGPATKVNPSHQDSPVAANHSPLPVAPCQGPNCGGRAPLAPLAPAPVVVRTVVEQLALVFQPDDEGLAPRGAPLCEVGLRPSPGFRLLLERPPRA